MKVKFSVILIQSIILLNSVGSFAQDEIKWEFTFNETEKELNYTANLAEGWHVYSQFLNENSGPVATDFSINANDSVVVSKKVREPQGIKVFDKNFNAKITYFSNSVVFRQKVKKIKETTILSGNVLYMICNDSGCLPPEVIDFSIKVKK